MIYNISNNCFDKDQLNLTSERKTSLLFITIEKNYPCLFRNTYVLMPEVIQFFIVTRGFEEIEYNTITPVIRRTIIAAKSHLTPLNELFSRAK